MMGGVEGPATLLDRASMGVMAGPTALRLPPSQDMSGNAGRRGRAVLPPRAMPGHRAYDAVGVWDGGTVASSRTHVRHVFCQIFVGRFGVSFSPFERLFLGRFGFGQSCGLSVIA
ncbi:Transcriptional regulator, LysR family [Bifidobacterium breve]|nr:Transcriptional regulator, LysR family [Bifidobacterium breve]